MLTRVSGGYYVYMEASGLEPGNKARLLSRMVNHGFSKTKCLIFWFHMYGADVDTLEVIIRNYTGGDTTFWKRVGNHGNTWMQGQLSLAYSDGPFQVCFYQRRETCMHGASMHLASRTMCFFLLYFISGIVLFICA